MSTKRDQGQAYRMRDRRPETRSLADGGEPWRPWTPPPMISPLSPALQFLAEHHTCAVCDEPIPYAAIVAAVQRGRWADYCSPKHRETAAKRRQRAK